MFTHLTIDNFSGVSGLILLGLLVLIGLTTIIIVNYYFTKYVLIYGINKAFYKRRQDSLQIIFNNHLLHRIAYLIPAFILFHFSYLFDYRSANLTILLAGLIKELTNIYLIFGISLVISSLLNCANDKYNQLEIAKLRPIKSYLQVAKIFLFSVTTILIASLLLDKSPIYFLSGVGAATAIIALLFKDSMLGFVASIQLSAYDMVRIGDWIEMPNFGVDGEVTEISLNTVKVQNFDKTIVTIPSYSLLTSGLKNWRGMQEAGGRRVKRSINIDINSIKMCDDNLLEKLNHLKKFLPEKFSTLTNVGLLRIYLENFLKKNIFVHKEMKILIRQLQGTPTGLPLELYFFINDTTTEKYESAQSEILEHVYALLPIFDLRVFQYVNDSR